MHDCYESCEIGTGPLQDARIRLPITRRDQSSLPSRLVSGLRTCPFGRSRPPSRQFLPVASVDSIRSATVAGAAPACDRFPNYPSARFANGTLNTVRRSRPAPWRAQENDIGALQDDIGRFVDITIRIPSHRERQDEPAVEARHSAVAPLPPSSQTATSTGASSRLPMRNLASRAAGMAATALP